MMFAGSWAEMCDQVVALFPEYADYYRSTATYRQQVRVNRHSVLVRPMDDLRRSGKVRPGRRGVVGRIERLAAFLDEDQERWMHFTLPTDAVNALLRDLFGNHQRATAEVIFRRWNHNSTVGYIKVATLNALDPVKVAKFFREGARAILEHNRLL